MITNIKILEKYCKDYKNIENYEDAVRSPLRYDLHHRREISENKSRKDLIDENLYYDRPPDELVFLEHVEHIRLHKANMSEETRQKISENNSRYWKGKPGPRKGKPSPNRGKAGTCLGKHWHLENGHRIYTE